MVSITFFDHEGEQRQVEVEPGGTVMQAATDNLLPGILADCGGACACATCHVVVDDSWADRIDPPAEDETSMLKFVSDYSDNSRLSCQITVTEELDGLVVHTPANQR